MNRFENNRLVARMNGEDFNNADVTAFFSRIHRLVSSACLRIHSKISTADDVNVDVSNFISLRE